MLIEMCFSWEAKIRSRDKSVLSAVGTRQKTLFLVSKKAFLNSKNDEIMMKILLFGLLNLGVKCLSYESYANEKLF